MIFFFPELIAKLCVSTIFLAVTIRALYNVTGHSLAKYPGRKLWSAFQFFSLYHLNAGDLPHCMKALHEKYGDVVRVGPKELSFNDPRAWYDIYGTRSDHATFRRPVEWRGSFPMSKAQTLITADEEDHERIRRALKPAFFETSLRELEPVIHKNVDNLVNILKIRVKQGNGRTEIDLASWIGYTTFDIIGSLVFGESFDCLKKGQIDPWFGVALQFRTALFEVSLKYYPWIQSIFWFLTPRSVLKPLNKFIATTHAKLQRCINQLDRPRDFLTYILNRREHGGRIDLSDEELDLNMSVLAIAGSETSASALSGAMNYLLRNPHSYDQLTEEIRFNIQDIREATAEKIAKLPFLTAVLQEALRLCPSVADGARRVVPMGGATVCGSMIPEGTIVSITPYAAFRSAKSFAYPEEWHPERWMGEDKRFVDDDRSAFRPFLLGKRACIGQQLAWNELRIVLARLLWEFDVNVTEKGIPVWTRQKIFTTWVKEPMYVEVTLTKRIVD